MRVLVAGLGSIGRKHLPAFLEADPATEFGALRSGRGSGATPDGVIEVEDVNDFSPDLVLVCTPPSVHAETVAAVAAPGRGLFVEKPLAHTPADVERIAALVRDMGAPFYHGTVLRHHPLLARVRELLESGELGVPLTYALTCGSWLPDWRPGQDYRMTYSARAELGGGVALDLIHEFDYAAWLFGAPLSIEGIRAQVSALELNVDDLCLAVCTHEGGLRGQVALSYFRPQPRRDFEIVCADGLLEGDLLTGSLAIVRGTGASAERTEERHAASAGTLLELQARRVLAALTAGEPGDDLEAAARLTEQVMAIPFEPVR